MARLTDIAIRAAKPSTTDVLLSDGRNLFLRIRPSGSKGWIVRIKRNGKRRVHTLGAFPTVSIKEARAKAALLVAVERGDARSTVKEAVEEYMSAIIRPRYKRVKNAEVYARRMTIALGKLSVDAVRPVDVSRVVQDYVREAPIAAMRFFGFTKGFFGWCVGKGYVEHAPTTDLMPRAFGVREETRERVLSDEELRAFWNADDLPHQRLLRFLMLTGLRIGEAQAARAEWLGTDGWLELPAEVMKNAKPHAAFVAPFTRAQIERSANPHLFTCVSPTAVQSALHRWQDRHAEGHEAENRWTAHDLRRTFASKLGDLGIAPHIIAKALSHTIDAGGEATPIYLRSDWLKERREAALALAAHVEKLVSTEPKSARMAR